jgi:hypothetical protein
VKIAKIEMEKKGKEKRNAMHKICMTDHANCIV